jgi:hypothetical protein
MNTEWFEVSSELRKLIDLAVALEQAVRNDAFGWGAGSGRMLESLTRARNDFDHAIRMRSETVAEGLLRLRGAIAERGDGDDARRFAWLESTKAHVGFDPGHNRVPSKPGFYVQTLDRAGLNATYGGETLRQAIDKAIAAENPTSALAVTP